MIRAPAMYGKRLRTLKPKRSKIEQITHIYNPLLDVIVTDIKSRRNHTTLVYTSDQFNYNFTGTMVVNDCKLSNVSCSQASIKKNEL